MNKEEYYLGIAEAVAKKSSCKRRQYGAVIVKNDEIIATGYNGVPRGEPHCTYCKRENMDHNTNNYDECESVHAEMNAIISAARRDMIGSTLYLVGFEGDKRIDDAEPCKICKRLIKNAGIKNVINYESTYAKEVDTKACENITTPKKVISNTGDNLFLTKGKMYEVTEWGDGYTVINDMGLAMILPKYSFREVKKEVIAKNAMKIDITSMIPQKIIDSVTFEKGERCYVVNENEQMFEIANQKTFKSEWIAKDFFEEVNN